MKGTTLDVVLVVALKALVGAWILHLGFSHVSDDDYARVVIAEQFAHAPRLDPSGTSWLPFPFWINGASMIAFGRSLATARAVAVVLGAISVAAPYVALRAMGVTRVVAIASVVVAMTIPWNAWLGVAMVPEASTAALIGAGAFAIGNARARLLGAAALATAALSRYEAWPVCAVMAIVAAVHAVAAWRRGDARAMRRDLAATALASVAPLAWMAWNAHAHGDAFHFLARVAAFRQASGAAAVPLAEKILGYPRAIVDAMGVVLVLPAFGVVALVDAEVRRRWWPPLAAMAAMIAFLIYGDVRDGAPTHHAARAIVAMFWVLTAFGADGVRSIATRLAWSRPQREMFVAGAIAAATVAWTASIADAWREYPARSAEERRDVQIARGRELRANRTESIVVTPCAFEHFALIASYAAPENARIAAVSARSAVTSSCPAVE